MTKEFTTKRGQKNEEATRHDIINNNTILIYTHWSIFSSLEVDTRIHKSSQDTFERERQ